jgi:hypothetical protein
LTAVVVVLMAEMAVMTAPMAFMTVELTFLMVLTAWMPGAMYVIANGDDGAEVKVTMMVLVLSVVVKMTGVAGSGENRNTVFALLALGIVKTADFYF